MRTDDFLDVENARIIADMIADPDTPDNLRVSMITKLIESRKTDNFFATIFEGDLTFGVCPHCKHENHWLIPEDELNEMGFVSHEKDERVKKTVTKEDCHWQQACKKKKITV